MSRRKQFFPDQLGRSPGVEATSTVGEADKISIHIKEEYTGQPYNEIGLFLPYSKGDSLVLGY